MSDTSTTTDSTTPALDSSTLTLVRVSPDYLTTGEAHAAIWGRALATPEGEERDNLLTFYATTSRLLGEAWATLIEPLDSDRAGGFWGLEPRDYPRLGLEGPHVGWNIERRYLSPVTARPSVDVVASPRPGDVLERGDRVRLIVDEGDGSSRAVIGDLGTVVDAGPSAWSLTTVLMDDGHVTRRDAHRFERVEEATHGPVESPVTEGRTYTAEEVEQAVREARQAERLEGQQALERWKERANEIAVQYAKDNDLCGNFERAMADIGLMGRQEWDEAHQRSYTVTFRIDVDAPPDDDDYAIRYEAAERLANMYTSSILDYAVEIVDDDGDLIWDA